MKILTSNQIAGLIPITILIHQLEEYLGQFPLWYSNLLSVQLSNQDFILINGVGLFVFSAFALSHFFNKNNLILAAFGTLIFANGITHLILSIFTFSYAPGTISGGILFIPLGTIIFVKIMPQLEKGEKIIAISLGLLVLFIVSLIAITI